MSNSKLGVTLILFALSKLSSVPLPPYMTFIESVLKIQVAMRWKCPRCEKSPQISEILVKKVTLKYKWLWDENAFGMRKTHKFVNF